MINDAGHRIENILDPGETLLWSGRPKQGILLRPSDIGLIPFSLFWGGFAFFWEYSVLKENGPNFMALFGIPFVAVGLYLILGRFFYDAWIRARTFYGLTPERAIVFTEGMTTSIHSVDITRAPEVTLVERKDRRGTISFSPRPMGNWPTGNWSRDGAYLAAFEYIDDARSVYRLILEQKKK